MFDPSNPFGSEITRFLEQTRWMSELTSYSLLRSANSGLLGTLDQTVKDRIEQIAGFREQLVLPDLAHLRDLEEIHRSAQEGIDQLVSASARFDLQPRIDEYLRALEATSVTMKTQTDQLAMTLGHRFALPDSYIASLMRAQGELETHPCLEQFAFLARANRDVLQRLSDGQRKLADLERQLSTMQGDYYLPSERIAASLVSTEALLGLGHLDDQLLDAALQPQLAFGEFARQQLAVAATASKIAEANRLLLVNVSADLLPAMNRGFELAILMRPSTPEPLAFPKPRVNLYRELAEELDKLDLEEADTDIEGVVGDSGAGQIALLGERLVHTVYSLNEHAAREGKEAVFTPTNRNLYACSLITTHVAADEKTFSDIVDHLFFLLYEGSGGAGRLSARLSDSELEALWTLKQLRLGARHDVDHGQDPDKKRRKIAEAYRALIGTVMPRSRHEWAQAQVALYRQLVEMLESLSLGNDTP
jgi:hypothetical protein